MPLRSWPSLFRRTRIRVGGWLRAQGHYRITREIGSGGMAKVYLAEKLGYGGFSKLFAVKVIKTDAVRDPVVRDMFVNEARLTANLIHTNIVQVASLQRFRDEYVIIMEYVFGKTLLEFIQRHKELGRPIPLDLGAYIIGRVCRGLDYAHNKHDRHGKPVKIVHRDICPSNVLISYRGVPKLSDFGVAKSLFWKTPSEKSMVVGKYPYMAPEQVRRQGTDARSDIYALSLVMYELFTGQIAYDVENTAMLREKLDDEHHLRPPVELAPDLPQGINDIIVKGAATDPKDRFQNAKEMSLELEAFLLRHWLFPTEEKLAEYMVELFPEAKNHRWW
jgi:serine/threonine protein kinase